MHKPCSLRDSSWTTGNDLRLLENGEEFFPRLFEAIDGAEHEALFETFIWFEDEIGTAFAERLIAAARRGVRVRVTVDGFGSPSFSTPFLEKLESAGVDLISFDPRPTFLNLRTNMFCRLHRKLAVIDRRLAFVGGINISDEHLRSFGDKSKQDYAVEVRGPVVDHIYECCRLLGDSQDGPWWRRWRYWIRRFPKELREPSRGAQALFATRDNDQHPTDIETLYRLAIRKAEREIIIACAYFFPGYRLTRDLRHAAKRGVTVRLIVQGNPDRPVSVGLASIAYDHLMAAGVKIYRYVERPLHAKVAVIDRHWATVGSSNLDPTSLGLNYEANLFVLDSQFSKTLRTSLEELLSNCCEELDLRPGAATWLRRILAIVAYHGTRQMPSWGRRFMIRKQRTGSVEAHGKDPA